MAERVDRQKDDEIDLAEIFASLWSHKILIVFITGISIFLSGYYALTAEKKYTASAVFEIKKNNANTLNIPSELGAIASLAGFGGTLSSATTGTAC